MKNIMPDDLESEWRTSPDGFDAGLSFNTWLRATVIEQRAVIAAAVQQEREACAKVADGEASEWKNYNQYREAGALNIAAAIRARGNGRE